MHPQTLMLLVCEIFFFLFTHRTDGLDSKNTAVAAHLALYNFTLKTSPPSAFKPDLKEPIPDKLSFKPIQGSKEWERGVVYAQSQNLARTVCHSGSQDTKAQMWLIWIF